ncbi:hypothetical protein JRQ81_006897 [Phrynocephalus forsythii]|uniref:Uncharacterized protein n=1 Tax=Phrynocephalus forsythii TaxID=171643 RepID=A0A9Q1AUK7_9SAUR|nr:hypothetical protein JRQ81_006897 [Phrynocephalus forsythii]
MRLVARERDANETAQTPDRSPQRSVKRNQDASEQKLRKQTQAECGRFTRLSTCRREIQGDTEGQAQAGNSEGSGAVFHDPLTPSLSQAASATPPQFKQEYLEDLIVAFQAAFCANAGTPLTLLDRQGIEKNF